MVVELTRARHIVGEKPWETKRLRLPITDAKATGTISNSDPVQRAWLGRFGRTAADHVLDGVRARLTAPREAGREGGVAGYGFDMIDPDGMPGAAPHADAWDRMTGLAGRLQDETDHAAWGQPPTSRAGSVGDLLNGTGFAFNGTTDGGGSYALWGRQARSGFDGREGTVGLDGTVTTRMLGTDFAAGRWLVGVALSHRHGEGGYESGRDGGRLGIDADRHLPPRQLRADGAAVAVERDRPRTRDLHADAAGQCRHVDRHGAVDGGGRRARRRWASNWRSRAMCCTCGGVRMQPPAWRRRSPT